MDAARSCRHIVLVAGLVALAGCGPNWEQLHSIADKQLEAARQYNEAVRRIAEPPSGNSGGEAHTVYQTRMAILQRDIVENRPTIFVDVLNYLGQRDQRLFQWLTLALNNPLTYALVSSQLGGGGGDAIRITADDGSRIENIDMTTGSGSPFITGSDNMTATRDGQIQNAPGNQQQVGSDPPIFNQPEGDINNDSSFSPGIALP